MSFTEIVRTLEQAQDALEDSSKMTAALSAMLDHIEAEHNSCRNCIRVLREFLVFKATDARSVSLETQRTTEEK